VTQSTVIESYITDVMGCPLISTDATHSSFRIADGCVLELQYFYSWRGDQPLYVGRLVWNDFNQPPQVELLGTDMTNEQLCQHLVKKALSFQFS
jgi:hypothetical protein